MRDYDKPATNPEPPDGTRVLVDMGDEWRTILRDDARAARYAKEGAHPEDRWFDTADNEHGEDGMGWVAHLKYAEAVYVIDEAARIEVTR